MASTVTGHHLCHYDAAAAVGCRGRGIDCSQHARKLTPRVWHELVGAVVVTVVVLRSSCRCCCSSRSSFFLSGCEPRPLIGATSASVCWQRQGPRLYKLFRLWASIFALHSSIVLVRSDCTSAHRPLIYTSTAVCTRAKWPYINVHVDLNVHIRIDCRPNLRPTADRRLRIEWNQDRRSIFWKYTSPGVMSTLGGTAAARVTCTHCPDMSSNAHKLTTDIIRTDVYWYDTKKAKKLRRYSQKWFGLGTGCNLFV